MNYTALQTPLTSLPACSISGPSLCITTRDFIRGLSPYGRFFFIHFLCPFSVNDYAENLEAIIWNTLSGEASPAIPGFKDREIHGYFPAQWNVKAYVLHIR